MNSEYISQCRMQKDESEKNKKENRRISVTFTETFNIPDEPDSKSPLSKKYIFALIYSYIKYGK